MVPLCAREPVCVAEGERLPLIPLVDMFSNNADPKGSALFVYACQRLIRGQLDGLLYEILLVYVVDLDGSGIATAETSLELARELVRVLVRSTGDLSVIVEGDSLDEIGPIMGPAKSGFSGLHRKGRDCRVHGIVRNTGQIVLFRFNLDLQREDITRERFRKPHYLAESAYELQMSQEKFKGLEFYFTSEFE